MPLGHLQHHTPTEGIPAHHYIAPIREDLSALSVSVWLQDSGGIWGADHCSPIWLTVRGVLLSGTELPDGWSRTTLNPFAVALSLHLGTLHCEISASLPR